MLLGLMQISLQRTSNKIWRGVITITTFFLQQTSSIKMNERAILKKRDLPSRFISLAGCSFVSSSIFSFSSKTSVSKLCPLISNKQQERCPKVKIIVYLQSECIEKYQVELCSKYDRKHDFDVIPG